MRSEARAIWAHFESRARESGLAAVVLNANGPVSLDWAATRRTHQFLLRRGDGDVWSWSGESST